MNAPVQQLTFLDPSQTADMSFAFELTRSRLLDVFFELEIAVARWLRHLGEKEVSRPLGQRLEQLTTHSQLEAKATPKQAKHIRKLMSDCAALLRIRNAAVHSHRTTGTKGDEVCFFLATIDTALNDERSYVVVTLGELEDTIREVRRLAGQLSHYLNQASSPRPPSQAAAIDP